VISESKLKWEGDGSGKEEKKFQPVISTVFSPVFWVEEVVEGWRSKGGSGGTTSQGKKGNKFISEARETRTKGRFGSVTKQTEEPKDVQAGNKTNVWAWGRGGRRDCLTRKT